MMVVTLAAVPLIVLLRSPRVVRSSETEVVMD